MRESFPTPITTDKDLEFYEAYLKQEFENLASKKFEERLKSLIGSLVKAECLISNRLEIRTGYLLEVGEDFILLKQSQSNQKTMLRTDTVKFLHILNDAPKNYTYSNSTIYKKHCQ